MNLAQLKATVAAYHNVDIVDLTMGPVDLFLVAANNARKGAEKLHDFEASRCTATLAIDGVSGGKLSDAIMTPTATFSGIKEIVAVSTLRNNSLFTPVGFTRADVSIEQDRDEIDLGSDMWPAWRYPSDSDVERGIGSRTLVQRGGSIYNFPRAAATTDLPLNVYFEAIGWLLDYVDSDLSGNVDTTGPKDFFVEHGFDFLQWSVIIELNYKFQTFVPRQEGNVGTPEKLRAEAWRDLLLWDSYSVDSHLTR